jgi:hypothetical protein
MDSSYRLPRTEPGTGLASWWRPEKDGCLSRPDRSLHQTKARAVTDDARRSGAGHNETGLQLSPKEPGTAFACMGLQNTVGFEARKKGGRSKRNCKGRDGRARKNKKILKKFGLKIRLIPMSYCLTAGYIFHGFFPRSY